MTDFWLSFLAGLAGSGHCLGMCGGIIAALTAAAGTAAPSSRLRLYAAYHAGRITTYALLGMIAGAASQSLLFLDGVKPALHLLFAAANLAVVVLGALTLIGMQRFGLSLLDGTGGSFLGRVLRNSSRRPSLSAYAAAGMTMGLIPCGMVYGVLITASTRGSWSHGAAMMAVFGLGTIPALLAYGQLTSALASSVGLIFQRVLGGAVMILGLIGLMHSLRMLGVYGG